MNPDTTPVFTASLDLPVGPDEAFELVTDPERLRRWAAVCATVDLRAGGSWSWLVTPVRATSPEGRSGRSSPGDAWSSAGAGTATSRYRRTPRRSR